MHHSRILLVLCCLALLAGCVKNTAPQSSGICTHAEKAYDDSGYSRGKKIELLTQCIDEAPESVGLPPFYYKRGYLEYKATQYTEAMGDFDAAIEIDPTYYDAYDMRGFIYYNRAVYPFDPSQSKRTLGNEPTGICPLQERRLSPVN